VSGCGSIVVDDDRVSLLFKRQPQIYEPSSLHHVWPGRLLKQPRVPLCLWTYPSPPFVIRSLVFLSYDLLMTSSERKLHARGVMWSFLKLFRCASRLRLSVAIGGCFTARAKPLRSSYTKDKANWQHDAIC